MRVQLEIKSSSCCVFRQNDMNEKCRALSHFLTDFKPKVLLRRSELVKPFCGCSVELGVSNGVNGTHTRRERALVRY